MRQRRTPSRHDRRDVLRVERLRLSRAQLPNDHAARVKVGIACVAADRAQDGATHTPADIAAPVGWCSCGISPGW